MENNNNDKKSLQNSLTDDCLEVSADHDKLLVIDSPTKVASPKKTFRMEGSDVLSRLRNFLPQLAASNQELANNPIPIDYGFSVEDIEESESSDDSAIMEEEEKGDSPSTTEPHIEINVGVGVFDVPNDPTVLKALEAACEIAPINECKSSASPISKPSIQEI